MSTRANIIISDDVACVYFYRHADGYPEETMKSLKDFVKGYSSGQLRRNVIQSSGWLVLHGHDEYKGDCQAWKVGAYEPTTEIHGDIEFLYEIDLANGELRAKTAQGKLLEVYNF